VSLTAARLLPAVPYFAWVLLFTALITSVNLRGIRMTARASQGMMAVMSLSTVLFLGLSVRFVVARDGFTGLWSPAAFFDPRSFELARLLLGAGIATLSYIGFDAISTLAEDTRRPERDIAFATVTVCVIQTVVCLATVYLAALVWPGYRSFPQADTAILDIGGRIGGPWMFGWITFVLLVAGLASSLTGQAGASRLLFGMGRDGLLPRRVFGYIDPRCSTPTRIIYVMAAATVAGAAVAGFQLVVELLNFGAFAGFILVNLSVIRHYYFRLRRRRGWDFLTNLVFPGLGFLVCTLVWLNLTASAKLAGFVWLGIGAVYLAIITRGFRIRPKPLGL
jgi:amino acid transporter